MIIEVSGEYVQEINFENVFPYNEHISFKNFVTDIENGFLYSNECIGKQWYFLPKTKMSQTKMTKISQTKHKIWSANRISEESQSGTTEGFVKLYVVRQ